MPTRFSRPQLCAALLLLVVVSNYPAERPAGEDLFKHCLIPDIQLTIPREAIASLTESPRRYVRATVREGKTVYTNVAIRLKGGPGSFRQIHEEKPAFTLNFDKFTPGQTFHGLKKIHLNNSVQDSSFLHEKISREIFEAAGVPVPRAGNAWVTLNGSELGMFVLLEGVNKQFLKRYFKDVSGNVHDGHSGNDVNQPGWRDISSGPPFKYSESRLKDLADAAKLPDLDDRLNALEKVLDMDRFLSFVALELMLGHWDGYTVNRNNFRVYHDRDSDRMVFMPHGLDQTFSRSYPLFPQNSPGFMTRSVLEIPEARERYRARYAEIVTNVFVPEWITNRIHLAAAKLETAYAEHNKSGRENLAPAFSREIRKRAAFLQKQIAPVSVVQFNGVNTAPLNQPTNWISKIDLGEAELDRETDSDGNVLLHIATDKGCTASWRTKVTLPAGSFRFQADIQTKKVEFDPKDSRAGAGVRISRPRDRTGQKNAGDNNWKPIHFDFEVGEEGQEVELVCELRASKGEIWYDVQSLKLIRK